MARAIAVLLSLASAVSSHAADGSWQLPTMAEAVGSQTADGNWQLHKMTEAAASKGAVCLDGSPAAYYLRQPLNQSEASKWVIFMEGGGWCGSDGNCQSRSLTDLGSSKAYPDQIGAAEGTGLYDLFATSTIVYMKYCDGSSFTGDVAAPIPNAGGTNGTIYYRGRRILDAMLEDLLTVRGLDAADELLFSGCSAGALTTYVHADYVSNIMKQRATKPTKVVALADAMFSLHYPGFPNQAANYYTRQFTWGFTAWNSSASVNQACLARFGAKNVRDAWVCFHGAIAAQFIATPIFIANSKHDTWQERGVLSLNTTECPGTVAADGTITLCNPSPAEAVAMGKYWADYGDAMVASLDQIPTKHAAFLTNCPTHCQTSGPGWQHPAFPGTVLSAAVAQWYPAAIANLGNETWSAPRWVARHGDECARRG